MVRLFLTVSLVMFLKLMDYFCPFLGGLSLQVVVRMKAQALTVGLKKISLV